MTFTISKAGVDFIKSFEGYSDKAYQDIVGVWTIGYGTTLIDGERVHEGMVCTEEQACSYLEKDVQDYLDRVSPAIKVDLTQGQVDSLASFAYNLGVGALTKSTLLRKLNAGDIKGAADEFLRWNKAGGKVVKGLTRRRVAERDVFLGNV